VVDAASSARAEEVLSLLRVTLDSLPVKPPRLTVPVVERLTAWVADGAPAVGLTLGDRCVLRDPADRGALVRCRGLALTDPEIHGHLAAGKQVVALGLSWNEQLDFVLDEHLALKQLRLSDTARDTAAMDSAADEQTCREADFLLLTGVLRPLLATLAAAFDWS